LTGSFLRQTRTPEVWDIWADRHSRITACKAKGKTICKIVLL